MFLLLLELLLILAEDDADVSTDSELLLCTMTGLPSKAGCPFSDVAMPVESLRFNSNELGEVSPGRIGGGT